MEHMDMMKRWKPISNMIERSGRMAYGEPFHKIGPFLKGKTKRMRGYAYYGVKQKENGRTFMRFDDRVYQVAPDGSWWRCRIMNGANGMTEIRPRF